MNRKSFTAILLGGALAGGCSKPNPLFLDTWDVITDSGSVSQTSAVTLETTTIEPPTTSDPPVTTTSSSTSPSTITSSSDITTTTSTTEPNPTTETTGEGFVCDGLDDDMDGCCELTVEVEADTFFSDAVDGVGMDGCPIAPLQDNPTLACRHISFGAVLEMAVFKDTGDIEAAVIGANMMALRFPTKDGQLVSKENGPIPTGAITSVKLEVVANYNHDHYADLRFTLLGLGVDGWVEGAVKAPTSCVDGLASFACLACGQTAGGPCDPPWPMKESITPELQKLGVVVADPDQDSGLAPIDLNSLDLPPTDWVPMIAGGLVMEPLSSTFKGQSYDSLMPLPGITIGTHEGTTPAHLLVSVCKQ